MYGVCTQRLSLIGIRVGGCISWFEPTFLKFDGDHRATLGVPGLRK
jgi:hypothetical protein